MKTVCDGLSALNSVGLDKSYVRCSSKHVGMISIITDLLEKSNFNFVKEHVFAHQDDLNRPLTMLEQLNCRMDILVKDIAKNENGCPRLCLVTKTSAGISSITCDGHLITSRVQQSTYAHILH